MTEDEIKQKLEDNEREAIQTVCDALKNYEGRIMAYLANFVAALCDVDEDDMFSSNNSLDSAQARSLFWYAYRYMTNETYDKIGRLSLKPFGKKFTAFGVSASVNKMHNLIEQQPIWRKRWTILKRVIKTQNALVVEPNIPVTITIPKNVELTIKKE